MKLWFKYQLCRLRYQLLKQLSKFIYIPFEVSTVYLYIIRTKDDKIIDDYKNKMLNFFENCPPTSLTFSYAFNNTNCPKYCKGVGITFEKTPPLSSRLNPPEWQISYSAIVYKNFNLSKKVKEISYVAD